MRLGMLLTGCLMVLGCRSNSPVTIRDCRGCTVTITQSAHEAQQGKTITTDAKATLTE